MWLLEESEKAPTQANKIQPRMTSIPVSAPLKVASEHGDECLCKRLGHCFWSHSHFSAMLQAHLQASLSEVTLDYPAQLRTGRRFLCAFAAFFLRVCDSRRLAMRGPEQLEVTNPTKLKLHVSMETSVMLTRWGLGNSSTSAMPSWPSATT